MRENWRIGSLLGIPLYIDSSWFFILLAITWVQASDIISRGLSGNQPWVGWLAGFVMALLLFASVLLHELGHSLVARSQGIEVNSITLFLFGGVASIARESKTPKGAFWVAIAGPLVSFLLFGVAFSLTQAVELPRLLQYVAVGVARLNLVLGTFNLIPGLPLDGGQVLKAIVWQVTGNRFAGVRWASASGKFLGLLAISLGLLSVWVVGDLGGLWIALIGWFIWRNANLYERLTALQESLLELTAADVMARDFRVVSARLTLQEFAQEYILAQGNFPTVYYAASEGRYRGLIRVGDLQAIERSLWESQTLADIAHPLTEIPSVAETTPLVAAINQLETQTDRSLTVLSPAGAVAGVIDRGEIVRAVAARHKLPVPEAEIRRIKAEGTYPPYLQLPAIAKSLQD